MVQAKLAAILHPVALEWAAGGNEGYWHRVGLPSVDQWQ